MILIRSPLFQEWGRKLWLVTVIFLISFALHGQVFDMVVAQDGSGDYTSVQSAIEDVAFNSSQRTLIFVKNGLYEEKVWVYSSRKNVSLIGESREGVIISWDDYSGKTAGMNTAESYTFLVEGDDFYAENITVRNTAGDVGQAVALRTTGDRQVFKNCRFTGFQDTYYAHKNRQYLVNCTIEGATDFIFGDATAVFDQCTVHCLEGGQFITAPADTKLVSTVGGETFLHGLLFIDCEITAGDDVPDNSYYLGRPWQPGASSVFINCTLGSHIKAEGWSTWSDDNHLLGRFAEYQSKDVSGDLVDVTGRVSWSEQLTSEETAYYSLGSFLQKDEMPWDPKPATVALTMPEGLGMASGTLTWDAVMQAKGYVISRNDSVIGFSMTSSFTDTAARAGSNIYQVKAINENGNLSEPSDELQVQTTITGVNNGEVNTFDVLIKDKQVIISERVYTAIYSYSGALVRKSYSNLVSLEALQQGLYLIKLVNRKGLVIVKKIVI